MGPSAELMIAELFLQRLPRCQADLGGAAAGSSTHKDVPVIAADAMPIDGGLQLLFRFRHEISVADNQASLGRLYCTPFSGVRRRLFQRIEHSPDHQLAGFRNEGKLVLEFRRLV